MKLTDSYPMLGDQFTILGLLTCLSMSVLLRLPNIRRRFYITGKLRLLGKELRFLHRHFPVTLTT